MGRPGVCVPRGRRGSAGPAFTPKPEPLGASQPTDSTGPETPAHSPPTAHLSPPSFSLLLHLPSDTFSLALYSSPPLDKSYRLFKDSCLLKLTVASFILYFSKKILAMRKKKKKKNDIYLWYAFVYLWFVVNQWWGSHLPCETL